MIRYSTKEDIALGDRMICWSTQDGDRREIPFSVLVDFMRDNLGVLSFTTVFSQPAANDFVVNTIDTSQNQWVIIQPVGAFADGTIVLPSLAQCIDGQEIIANCSQQVTSFAVSPNGALAVVGAPTTLAAGDAFRLKFSSLTSSWYAI